MAHPYLRRGPCVPCRSGELVGKEGVRFMARNLGKPSGKFAEEKTSPGRKGNYKRSGWPEEVPTQRTRSARGQQQGKARRESDREEEGRDYKAGGGRRF